MKLKLDEGKFFDAFLLFQFLRKLTTPFQKTKAFKLGIIDKDGNLLKKRSELKTKEEKNAFTLFDLLVTNLKRFIQKFPGGKSNIATYAAALWLMKESNVSEEFTDSNKLFESYYDTYCKINFNESTKRQANINYLLFVEKAVKKDFALELLNDLNVDPNTLDIDEFMMGLDAESDEHSDVVDNWQEVAKITLAHLEELPDYYTKLKTLETEDIANSVGDGTGVALDEPIVRKKKRKEN